ncbi:MAG: hypothetical protein IJH71_01770, partial [Eubacterium sp.]|nr:hypothetical protein [Eubacterium sp.]
EKEAARRKEETADRRDYPEKEELNLRPAKIKFHHKQHNKSPVYISGCRLSNNRFLKQHLKIYTGLFYSVFL